MDYLPAVGDLVITHKPGPGQPLYGHWTEEMDAYDGYTGRVLKIKSDHSETVYISHGDVNYYFYYHISWLEPVKASAQGGPNFDETKGDF